jgi:hypothetical protein
MVPPDSHLTINTRRRYDELAANREMITQLNAAARIW